MTNDVLSKAGTAMDNSQSMDFAQHLADALKDHPHAEVRVNPTVQAPIPPHIAGNLLEFLRRVKSEGMEAIAWVEAYQYVQQHVPQQPGVAFGGLPTPPPKR
jgi:hypothetical protein